MLTERQSGELLHWPGATEEKSADLSIRQIHGCGVNRSNFRESVRRSIIRRMETDFRKAGGNRAFLQSAVTLENIVYHIS